MIVMKNSEKHPGTNVYLLLDGRAPACLAEHMKHLGPLLDPVPRPVAEPEPGFPSTYGPVPQTRGPEPFRFFPGPLRLLITPPYLGLFQVFKNAAITAAASLPSTGPVTLILRPERENIFRE